jgi:ABC-type lipoprotein export system ATPase subunit
MAIVRLENIKKSYKLGVDLPARIVLDNIHMEINEGDSVAVTGPSGTGKSTLLNLIGTIDQADSGKIWFRDRELSTLNADQLADLRNKEVGFIFQQHHLLPQLTMYENVLLPLLEEKDVNKRQKASERAEVLLRWVGIEKRKDQFPWQLSGGELQRAAVVRALINQPDLILADEPTGSLDEENANLLVDLLMRINEEKKITVVMVTHSMDLASRMKIHYRISGGSLEKI